MRCDRPAIRLKSSGTLLDVTTLNPKRETTMPQLQVEYLEGNPRKFLQKFDDRASDVVTLGDAMRHLESMTMPELQAIIADPNDPPGQIYDEIHRTLALLIEDWGDEAALGYIFQDYPEDARERDDAERRGWGLGGA